jgi:hypothetical protein
VNIFVITVFKIVRTDAMVAAFIYRSVSITSVSTAAVAIAIGPGSVDRWRPSPSHRSALGAASLTFSNSRSPRAGSGC